MEDYGQVSSQQVLITQLKNENIELTKELREVRAMAKAAKVSSDQQKMWQSNYGDKSSLAGKARKNSLTIDQLSGYRALFLTLCQRECDRANDSRKCIQKLLEGNEIDTEEMQAALKSHFHELSQFALDLDACKMEVLIKVKSAMDAVVMGESFDCSHFLTAPRLPSQPQFPYWILSSFNTGRFPAKENGTGAILTVPATANHSSARSSTPIPHFNYDDLELELLSSPENEFRDPADFLRNGHTATAVASTGQLLRKKTSIVGSNPNLFGGHGDYEKSAEIAPLNCQSGSLPISSGTTPAVIKTYAPGICPSRTRRHSEHHSRNSHAAEHPKEIGSTENGRDKMEHLRSKLSVMMNRNISKEDFKLALQRACQLNGGHFSGMKTSDVLKKSAEFLKGVMLAAPI